MSRSYGATVTGPVIRMGWLPLCVDRYADVRFAVTDNGGNETLVKTLEEEMHPGIYYKGESAGKTGDQTDISPLENATSVSRTQEFNQRQPEERHLVFKENQRGVKFDDLFGPYVRGANKIVVTDPYIRMFHQARSLMEFIETVVRFKGDGNVEVELITVEEEFRTDQQLDFFQQIQKNCIPSGILFSWKFEPQTAIHARHINIDNRWKIILDRGLDIFQRYEMNDAFSLSNRLQEHRSCKPFEVTYLKTPQE